MKELVLNMVDDLVSIIMPSYNTGKFITESIDSVLAQTYQNWELIIVDDCSIDDTEIIVRKYLADPRIKFFKNEKNSGAALSRNKAIREARGRFIAFLDSDDLWLPSKLEKQIQFMKENQISFTYTKYLEMDENGRSLGKVVSGPKEIGKLKMKLFNFIGCLTVIYDSEVVGEIQVPDLKKRNDWAMWLNVVDSANCYLFPEILSKYRVRKSGSITHVKGGKIVLLKHHILLFENVCGMSPFMAYSWSFINLPVGVLKRKIYVSNQSV